MKTAARFQLQLRALGESDCDVEFVIGVSRNIEQLYSMSIASL